MHLWKECSMLERMWLIFLTVSYVLLYGFGQINLLTTATAFMGSVCMFLGAKAKISNFYPGASTRCCMHGSVTYSIFKPSCICT